MAQLRSTYQLRTKLRDDVGAMAGVCSLIAFILAGVIIGGAAISMSVHSSDFDTARMNRAKLNSTLSAAHNPSQLQAKARTLLEMRREGYTDVIDNGDYGSITDKDVLTAVQRVAQTGQPLHLENHHYSWHYFRDITWITLLSTFFLLSLTLFVAYWTDCCKGSRHWYFLADMPWKQVWPALFVAVTPIGWPFYVGSAVRLRRELQRKDGQRPEEPRPRGYYWDDEDEFYHRPARVHVTEERPQAKPKFVNAPVAARNMYRSLRVHTWRTVFNARQQRLQGEERDLTECLRELGEEIRAKQTRRNKVRAQLKELEGIDAANATAPGPEALDAEFDRLTSLPGIKGVRVVNDQVCLLLEARIDWGGQRYDLGDWELRFGADTSLITRELRSGVRSGWYGGYPAYRLGGGEFCFGNRSYTIEDNLRKGQFLEAIELAVDCMQSVNPEHAFRIPEAFKKEVEST